MTNKIIDFAKSLAICAIIVTAIIFATTFNAHATTVNPAADDAGVALARTDIFTSACEVPESGAVTGVVDSDVLGCDIIVVRGDIA